LSTNGLLIPGISINIFSMKDAGDPYYSIAFRMTMYDNVYVPRIECLRSLPVWQSNQSVFTVGPNKIGQIRDEVKDKLDELLVDYLKANPKK